MKKYLLGLFALTMAIIGLSAFTIIRHQHRVQTDYFIYQLSDNPGSDDHYEDAGNWVFSPDPPAACQPTGFSTCYVTVDHALIDNYAGADEKEQFAAFLAAQASSGTPYTSALAAVNSLRGSHTKPVN